MEENFKRYNISQLSRETNTNRAILVSWIDKGFLIPTQQTFGAYPKYSIEAFLKAEKLAKEECIEQDIVFYRRITNTKKITPKEPKISHSEAISRMFAKYK